MSLTMQLISTYDTKKSPSLEEMTDSLKLNVKIYEEGVKTLAKDGLDAYPDSYHAGVIGDIAVIATLFPAANTKDIQGEYKNLILQDVSKRVHNEINAIERLREMKQHVISADSTNESPSPEEMINAMEANVEIYVDSYNLYPDSYHAGIISDTAIIITLLSAARIKDMYQKEKNFILEGVIEAVEEGLVKSHR